MSARMYQYQTYMEAFFKSNDQLPPVQSLADGMGVTPNAAHEMLAKMAIKGVIEKNSVNKWRWAR